MEWRGRRGSGNIEDRRGMGGGAVRIGGIGGFGAILILVVGWLLGVDLTPLINGGDMGPAPQGQQREISEADREAGNFVSVVLAGTEEVWTDVFREQLGETYRPPVLVLYSGVASSPCGGASGATGPFYCPGDQKVYLDTDFFRVMAQKLGAGGDFAAAYVVAHEVGHHVQDELGILGKVNEIRQQSDEVRSNELSVRIELQADCLAGIWARQSQAKYQWLNREDLDEALNAAAQIGDDTLMRNAGRVPMPESFTHGTSEQRQRWFARGWDSGRLDDCNTFQGRI